MRMDRHEAQALGRGDLFHHVVLHWSTSFGTFVHSRGTLAPTLYLNRCPTSRYSPGQVNGRLNLQDPTNGRPSITGPPPRQESGARRAMSDPSLTARYNNPKKRH